ncbi:hypothetical protein TIFTF001_056028, partial [Ficus carica]
MVFISSPFPLALSSPRDHQGVDSLNKPFTQVHYYPPSSPKLQQSKLERKSNVKGSNDLRTFVSD